MTRDISEWLESIGLDKYASLFADNEIDLDAARDLTESDLKELELPMGPRKKLLRAISELAASNRRPSQQSNVDGSATPHIAASVEATARSCAA